MMENISLSKISITAISVFLVLSSLAFAEDFRILKVKGKVMIQEFPESNWQKAKNGGYFSENAQLSTKRNSECTIGSGEKINSVFTLKENSQLVFEDAAKKRFYLQKGRVFSLIEKRGKESKFEIKTPVAIAGVRGTGWSVDADKDTSVRCYEGEVYVQSLDEGGQVASDEGVKEGSGIKVSPKGQTDKFELSKKDKKEWQSFRGFIKNFIGKPIGEIFNVVGSVTDGALDAYLGDEGENPYHR